MKLRFLLIFSVLFCPLSFLKGETYVVAVGIANYKNASNLTLTENDAISFANVFKTKTKNVITMTGRYATHANIVKALKDQFARAKVGDMIVFFFSGHGFKGGFCPYDVVSEHKQSLSYNEIYSIFRSSKASKKVIIADACMSGGLRKEKKTTSSTSQKHPSDVVMFLSSRTKEYSIESRKMTNGFFTTYLLKGLRGGADTNRDRVITAKEIYTYVSDNVRNISQERQHPVMWGNFSDNFIMMDWRK